MQLDLHRCESSKDAEALLTSVLSNECSYEELCGFLTELRTLPLSEQMLVGFRQAMMNRVIPVEIGNEKTVDICGTGGDGKDTINISTLTALTVASCGVLVTKHGNTSFSSTCGSSDILSAIGIPLPTTPDQVKQQLELCGISFLHAPFFHPSMKTIGAARKKLRSKTIFNVLGPLCNPIQSCTSMLGVADYSTFRGYKALLSSRTSGYAVIWDEAGYDEVSLTARSFISMNGSDFILNPEDLIGDRLRARDLAQGASMEENQKLFLKICCGQGSQAHERVIASNAAIALKLMNPKSSLSEGFALASETIRSGKIMKTIQRLQGQQL